MTENSASAKMKNYKNLTHLKNTEDMRMRRHEVTVELRKSKKEDQLFKRRNINEDEEASSPQKEQAQVQMSVTEIVAAMNSEDDEKQFLGTQAARKMLSRERNPPIDLMIGHGIVPICVNFLQCHDNPLLQFEAAWALTNIASGTSEQTKAVIDADAIPCFIALLQSSTGTVAEQAVWALGNIAGDGPAARDYVLSFNVIDGIIRLIENNTPLSFLRNIVWLMSNLCRNKNPPPPFEKIKALIPILSELLESGDAQVLADACWALSYVTDDENYKIQAVIDLGCVPRLVALLDCNEPTIIVPALRSVGNIVTGSDSQTDSVIAAGGLQRLAKLLLSSKQNIVKEAAWTVSNITAGNQKQIQEVINCDIFFQIRDVLEKGDFKSQKEAAWAVTNTTSSGSPQQVVTLIEKYDILKPYLDLLGVKDARTVKVILTGLENIFSLAEKLNGVENLCIRIEEIGVLHKLEALQRHENEEVYKKAFDIIDNYFGEDGESTENELAPVEIDGTFNFNPNSDNAPPGGYMF